MNGAELPCGTVIHVEASDPLHKLRRKEQANDRCGPVHEVQAPSKAVNGNEDDLEDFFASLDEEQNGEV